MLKTKHPSLREQGQISFKEYTVKLLSSLCLALSFVFAATASADDAAIVEVSIKPTGERNYMVSVTIAHEDTGWDHYANRWDVLDEQGNVLGSRVLAHPHVNEQPFTRSLRLEIPASVKTITIVAADSVHGDNTETVQVEVPSND